MNPLPYCLFKKSVYWIIQAQIRFYSWEWLNVGTVPTFKKHNVGTVPTFKTHNIGTVPTFKMHNVGTVPTYKMHNVGTPKFYDFF